MNTLYTDIYKISFAQIHVINPSLAEITVDSGVDIDLVMVDEIHKALL